MKQKIFFLDFTKILPKFFCAERFKLQTKEKVNTTVCPCQELMRLTGEMRLISEQLEKINSKSRQTQEVKAENINIEKIVLESLSFELGNIDVDAINGTMNIGITVNLSSGALSLPSKIKVAENTTNKNDSTLPFDKQNRRKKASYNVYIRPDNSIQEITLQNSCSDNNNANRDN